MACLLKPPSKDGKGCVVFTTPERDHIIGDSGAVRDLITRLRDRFLIGLHHNWHDHDFRYDSLYDFSMAGEGDLIERNGKEFPYIPLDACNFAPSWFSQGQSAEPFWDVLFVGRAVAFKGIPEFLLAIRTVYDMGKQPRVLFICPTPDKVVLPGISDLRSHFESLFTVEERQRVTLLTIGWDYPFPLDLESLSHFYRHARVFVHPAPEERRCRTAAYAWATGIPVVSNSVVASILPLEFHREPFLFAAEDSSEMPKAILRALETKTKDDEWPRVASCFSAGESARRLDTNLTQVSDGTLSPKPINPSGLDIRLGRHHSLSTGGNRLPTPLASFCEFLLTNSDEMLESISLMPDPEVGIEQALQIGASEVPAQRNRNHSLAHQIFPMISRLIGRN